MGLIEVCKRLLIAFTLVATTIVLSACGTVAKQSELIVDTEAPTTYAEYKLWRDRYDPDAKEYAEFKAWEAQYRRWQWEQQQNNNR